jgi:uncharacterized membrane protein YbhN (UPF0104 family)
MIFQVLRFLGSLGLLGAVLYWVAPQDIFSALSTFDPLWFGAAIAALTAQTVLSARRWQITARALGMNVRFGWSVQEYGLSMASNTFLPGGVLGDLTRVLRARHHGWKMATASVVIERFAGQIALALAAFIGLVLWHGPVIGLIVAIVGAAILLTLTRLLPGPWRLVVQCWGTAGVWPQQIALSLLILLANLFGFWACARATGLNMSVETAFALIPLTLLSMLVPVTINGWGVREAVAAALWPFWSIAPAQAVAATVVFGLACMASAAIGLIPWLFARRAQDVTEHPAQTVSQLQNGTDTNAS